MKKRKGGFLLDALLGMMILLMAIIPLVAAITFAYSALTSSVEKRARLDDIYSEVAQDIVNFSMGNADFRTSFNKPVTTGIGAIHGGHGSPTTPFSPRLFYAEKSFGVSGRDAGSVVNVYIVK